MDTYRPSFRERSRSVPGRPAGKEARWIQRVDNTAAADIRKHAVAEIIRELNSRSWAGEIIKLSRILNRSVPVFFCCVLILKTESVSPGTGPVGTGEDKSPAVMIFKGVNVFEGNTALIFRDMRGRDVWFSHSDIVAADAGLISVKEIPGSVLPEIRANGRMKGKAFRLYYDTEILPNEFSGEDVPVRVLKKIEPVRGVAGK